MLIVCAGGSGSVAACARRTGAGGARAGTVAYKTGSYDAALPALKEAAARGNDVARFFAEFYLARIYADSAGTHDRSPKAFMLFRKLADENADIDPDDDRRAPFVAKALIALASYVRSGVREIGVPPNPRRAANYLHHAAIFFGDKDAQFELAKLYLSAEGGNDDVRRGMHYLSTLSEQSYPAAQALLAELYWTGRHVKTDERRALALITMAVENAPAHERIWIEEIYHNIYLRDDAWDPAGGHGIMARWRKMFARPVAEPNDRTGLGGRELLPERQCADGEAVAIRRAAPMAGVAAAPPPAGPSEAMQGSALSLGFRAAAALRDQPNRTQYTRPEPLELASAGAVIARDQAAQLAGE